MKKTLLVLGIITLNCCFSWSQKQRDSISFTSSFRSVSESYFKDNPYSIIKIPIFCTLKRDKDIIVNVKCDSSSCSKRIIFPESTIIIKKGTTERILMVNIQNDSIIKSNIDYFTLTLVSKDTFDSRFNTQVIEIQEFKDIYNPNNPYKFAIGTNFDFVEGVKPNSFYAEISTFQPNLIFLKNSKNRSGFKTIGIYGGLYQNRNISPDSNYVSLSSYSKMKYNGDSIGFRETYLRKPEIEMNNLGLYFGLTLSLLETVQRDLKFNAYLSLHTELIHQQRTTRYSYKTTSMDTLLITQVPSNSVPTDKIKSINEISNLYYIGLGIPMLIITDKVEFMFRPTFGCNWITREDLKTFYLYQFSLTEKKYGICITGEYRGNFGEKETLISISLSKIFDISKLIEYR